MAKVKKISDKDRWRNKHWCCMTDWEKNDWLREHGFSVRYPLKFGMPVTPMVADIMLDDCFNPKIPIGF